MASSGSTARTCEDELIVKDFLGYLLTDQRFYLGVLTGLAFGAVGCLLVVLQVA